MRPSAAFSTLHLHQDFEILLDLTISCDHRLLLIRVALALTIS